MYSDVYKVMEGELKSVYLELHNTYGHFIEHENYKAFTSNGS